MGFQVAKQLNLLILTAISFLMVGCGSDISGTITDKGEPLEGVEVLLCDFNNSDIIYVTTDDEGKYLFTGISPGNYKIVPTHTARVFQPVEKSVEKVLLEDIDGVDFESFSIGSTDAVSITSAGGSGAPNAVYGSSVSLTSDFAAVGDH